VSSWKFWLITYGDHRIWADNWQCQIAKLKVFYNFRSYWSCQATRILLKDSLEQWIDILIDSVNFNLFHLFEISSFPQCQGLIASSVRITIGSLQTTKKNYKLRSTMDSGHKKRRQCQKRNWSSKKILNEIPAIQTNNNRMKKKLRKNGIKIYNKETRRTSKSALA